MDADLWNSDSGKVAQNSSGRNLVEVEHVKTHRSEKERQQMSHFQKFVTEGNEKADELAKEGAVMDGGVMALIRASVVEQEREEVSAVLQYAAKFHCLVEYWHDCEQKKSGPLEREKEAARHKIEWCPKASRYRCVRCGRSSQYVRMKGTCAVQSRWRA